MSTISSKMPKISVRKRNRLRCQCIFFSLTCDCDLSSSLSLLTMALMFSCRPWRRRLECLTAPGEATPRGRKEATLTSCTQYFGLRSRQKLKFDLIHRSKCSYKAASEVKLLKPAISRDRYHTVVSAPEILKY